MIRFLHKHEKSEVDGVDPNTPVLDYVRDHLDKIGTKEGCAAGDCGACTVVLGELHGGELRYRAVNSCITPIGHLQGKQLITVEDLRQAKDLHPVQQALVDCHGSQCGFCTPGFVMSLFAHRNSHAGPERREILRSLGGNLCRCTGYRPIIDAAVQMYESAATDSFSRSREQTCAALLELRETAEPALLRLAQKSWRAPRSVMDLARQLEQTPGARLVAGGTDLFLEITQSLAEFETLIFTGAVSEMREIADRDQVLEIGAAVSLSDCEALLAHYWPDLEELIDRFGSVQIRNQATLGGNIANASPIGDMPPALIALDAQLLLRRGQDTRLVSLEDFFSGYRSTLLEPAEFIERIRIPKPSGGGELRVYKISKRLEDDISAVCGAFNIRLEDGFVAAARIAFGGMAETPGRARHCEQALLGQPWDRATIAKAMAALGLDFSPISDFRASAEYRRQVAQNLLLRRFLEPAPPASQPRVSHYA